MGLFRNRNRPRSSLDLRVGSSHVVEVLLHLRRADWDWYRSNETDIEEEFLELMDQNVIPRVFEEHIENYHRTHNPEIFPPDKKVGAKNQTNKGKSNNNSSNKRKNRQTKATVASTKKQAAEASKEKPEKEVYYAFGEILQLAYRKEALPTWNQGGQTVFFKEDSDDQDGFYDRPKLPHRLLIWCSKIDPHIKTHQDPDGVGFFRPEMIPISSLFREPEDLGDGIEP